MGWPVPDKPPLPGRILGWLAVVVAVACAGRLVWELLQPLLVPLGILLMLGLVYLTVTRRWLR
jgi:hypothetical protein